ncbi:MAG: prepilin-type N-terminal cleavage/methylation domain-containing protein [Bryobacterales bacterium]|nr:prepilin-type N-terminal cleavage/methylation domain-containing protein [Bryobacteraceae bacterium]MDW8131193.1 prepilin-type N-terminal cleavage/methylation domain-containing protein [Bryobacterales bacterium]
MERRARQDPRTRAGVTLVELLIVVALISLLVGITFPAVGAGVDSLRLAASANRVASFLNAALNRAERWQQAVEITVEPVQNRLRMRAMETIAERALELDEGVRIAAVHPALPHGEEQPRRFLLLPGGTVPRITIELRNRRGTRKLVSVDPITGVPRIETPGQER